MNEPACPPAERLQAFLCGRLHGDDADAVADHLSRCSVCITRLPSLTSTDPLVELIRTNNPLSGHASSPGVQRLVNWLSCLRVLHVEPGEVTTAASDLHTPAPPGELTGELAPFLDPPQREGDLGQIGPYRLVELLGAGGMGVVFKAEDPQLSRHVALKTLRLELARSEQGRKRFLREARAIAALTHDHIVPIYHVGEQKGVPYLVMPLLEGRTLEAHLKKRGALSFDEVRRLGGQIAEGLGAAHQHGLVHRDVKPDNIWLEVRPDGIRAKLLDFGLARPEEEAEPITQVGSLVGTPAYLAPEVVDGQDATASSDLYSLGCVLYRMATGQMPFRDRAAHRHHAITPPRDVRPDLPPDLERLLLALLAERREDRPASARVVADILRPVPSGRSPPSLRNPLFVFLALFAALAVLGWWLVRSRDGGGHDPGDRDRPRFDPARIPRDERFSWQPSELVAVLGNHRLRCWGPVSAVVFHPDGKQLASVSLQDGCVRLWDIGARMRAERRLPADPHALAFSSDGRILAVGGIGGVWLFDVDEDKLAERCRLDVPGSALSVCFSPDDRTLAAACNRIDGGLLLWDVKDTSPKFRARWSSGSTGQVVRFAPTGTKLALGCTDGTVQLLEPAGDRLVSRGTIPCPHREPSRVAGLEFGPSDTGLLAAWYHGAVGTWDCATDTPAPGLTFTSDDFINGCSVLPDGTIALACRTSLRLLERTPGSLRQVAFQTSLQSPLLGVAGSRDGTMLTVCHVDHGIRLHDRAGTTVKERLSPDGPNAGCRGLELSADGKTLAVTGRDGVIRLWDLSGPEPVPGRPFGSGQGMETIRMAPNARLLVGLLFWERMESWDLSCSPPTRIALPNAEENRGAVALAADGCTLFVACTPSGKGPAVRRLSLDGTGQVSGSTDHPMPAPVTALGLKRNGSTLATGHDGGIIRLWPGDLNGEPTAVTLPKSPRVTGLAFSPSGDLLVAQLRDRPASLIDCEAVPPRPCGSLGSEGEAIAVAVGPDGKLLATSDWKGRVLLWRRTAESKPFHVWQMIGPVYQLAFLPDGKHLLTGNANGTVYTLRLP